MGRFGNTYVVPVNGFHGTPEQHVEAFLNFARTCDFHEFEILKDGFNPISLYANLFKNAPPNCKLPKEFILNKDTTLDDLFN